MELTYYKADMAKINIGLCLQGGGSATAWQAGALIPFILNPHIHVDVITGTSGGAFNGGILKSIFARHGQGPKGKELAVKTLIDAWKNNVAIPNISAQIASWHQMVNPVGHAVAIQANRGHFTRQLEKTIFSVMPDDEALESDEGPAFFVQTVDDKSGRGHLYTGKKVTREKILASAALKDCFHSVNGEIDGAYLGGANPPTPPTHLCKKLDWILFFMTVAEPLSVRPRLQKNLKPEDFDNDQIITGQAYGEIEYLRQKGHKVDVIAPEKSFSKNEKGMTGQSVLCRRMNDGMQYGMQKHDDFMQRLAVCVPA